MSPAENCGHATDRQSSYEKWPFHHDRRHDEELCRRDYCRVNRASRDRGPAGEGKPLYDVKRREIASAPKVRDRFRVGRCRMRVGENTAEVVEGLFEKRLHVSLGPALERWFDR